MLSLRHGARGADVIVLQQALVDSGYSIALSGVFDDATESAVRAYQAAAGLVVDGIVGPRTRAALKDVSLADSLSQDDIERAAQALGVDVAAVTAVNEIESRGEGFISHTRLPAILFERHVMYRRLQTLGLDAAGLMAAHPNIVNTQPGGYKGGLAEHQRLDAAEAIHLACAIEATSWGLFQIMGEHWAALKYRSARAFAVAMCTSEADQLDAFVRFIQHNNRLHAALRNHDWAAFARGYNGSQYAKNDYDHKLAAAYRRHASAPETQIA